MEIIMDYVFSKESFSFSSAIFALQFVESEPK